MRDNWELVAILAVCFALLIIAFWLFQDALAADDDANALCMQHGYVEARRAHHAAPWYCYRRVDGTDELVPLCRLTGGCEE